MERRNLSEVLLLNQSGTWGDEGNENDFPVLRSSNIQDGRLTLDDVAYRKVSKNKIDEFKLEDGDILVTKSSGSSHLIGKCCLFKNPNGKTFLYSNFTQRLRVNKNILLPELLFHYLNSSFAKEYLQKISNTTSGLRNLNMKDYAKQSIPILPIKEQQKIAGILEQADAARQKRKQANQLTEQFLQSAFLEMFGDPVRNEKGWEVKTLEELSEEIVDCPHTTPNHQEEPTEFPCIRTTDMKDGFIVWDRMKYVQIETYKERTRRLVPREGDIIFAREGSFGEAARVPKNLKVCLGQRTMLFRPNSKLCTSEFLWSLIMSDAVYNQAVNQTSGSTVSHVNVKDIKKFKGFYPPLPLQKKFATLVEQVEQLRVKQRESEKELENLFGSLMQRYFG